MDYNVLTAGVLYTSGDTLSELGHWDREVPSLKIILECVSWWSLRVCLFVSWLYSCDLQFLSLVGPLNPPSWYCFPPLPDSANLSELVPHLSYPWPQVALITLSSFVVFTKDSVHTFWNRKKHVQVNGILSTKLKHSFFWLCCTAAYWPEQPWNISFLKNDQMLSKSTPCLPLGFLFTHAASCLSILCGT